MVSTSFFTVALFATIAFVSAAPSLTGGSLIDVDSGYIGTRQITAENIANGIGTLRNIDISDNANDLVVGK